MAAMSDYLENKLIDQIFRGQAFGAPATLYMGLLTASPSDAAGGTEVTGGGYARVAITSSLANWAGTQAAGSTAASSGSNGTTSNNAAVTFPAPTLAWGAITSFALYDALTGGNMLIWGGLAAPKTVSGGDAAPSFAIGALSYQIDN